MLLPTDARRKGRVYYIMWLKFHAFFFEQTNLYYTRKNTNTRQYKYRNVLGRYTGDSCPHSFAEKTLDKEKITTRSVRSFPLCRTIILRRRPPPTAARPSPEKKENNRDIKGWRSTFAQRL